MHFKPEDARETAGDNKGTVAAIDVVFNDMTASQYMEYTVIKVNKRGVKRLGPFSLEHEHTYLDEAVGYCVAACGFYVQWHLGFAAPFPLNLVLLPLDALEWYIRYSVSTTSN